MWGPSQVQNKAERLKFVLLGPRLEEGFQEKVAMPEEAEWVGDWQRRGEDEQRGCKEATLDSTWFCLSINLFFRKQ